MKRKIKRALILLVALALVFVLAGCGRASETGGIPTSTGGRDIEKGYSADHVFSLNSNSNFSFNPSVATNHSNQLICSLVYENLVEVDNNFEIIEGAGLIREWTVSEDGKTWPLRERPGRILYRQPADHRARHPEQAVHQAAQRPGRQGRHERRRPPDGQRPVHVQRGGHAATGLQRL